MEKCSQVTKTGITFNSEEIYWLHSVAAEKKKCDGIRL